MEWGILAVSVIFVVGGCIVLQGAGAASARLAPPRAFRGAACPAERVCILTTNVSRELAREVDWEEWTPAEIVDAFGGGPPPGGGGGGPAPPRPPNAGAA